MLALILSSIVVLFTPTQAHLCYSDTTLDDVQDYSYELPYSPFDDYWNNQRIDYNRPDNSKTLVKHNLHLGFTVFGKFVGNTDGAVIRAGYYGEYNKLIYSVEVNCASKSWKSFAPSAADPKIPAPYQTGVLEKGCLDGEEFDLIFKVKQAHQFAWLFNGEPLQKGMQVTHFARGAHRKPRNRTLNVPSPDESPRGGAAKAVKFNVETSGAAVMTRFAFGRCVAWPRNLPCNETRDWLWERSKGESFRATHGAHNTFWTVSCLSHGLEHLFWPTQLLHGDEFAKPQSGWVCCLDMKTGEIWKNDKARFCRHMVDWISDLAPDFCHEAFDEELIKAEEKKLDSSI